jgi:hypothetical protein
MESKYLIGLGGVAVIGFLAYSLTEENKRNKALREKEVLAKETEMANKLLKTQSELKAKLDAEAKAKALADSRYTPAEAAAKSLFAITEITKYFSQIPTNELDEPNQILEKNKAILSSTSASNNVRSAVAVASQKMMEFEFANSRVKNKTLGEVIANFKKDGAIRVYDKFKGIMAEFPKDTADKIVKLYPKIFLKDSLQDFPIYYKKHINELEYTPEETIFLSQVGD